MLTRLISNYRTEAKTICAAILRVANSQLGESTFGDRALQRSLSAEAKIEGWNNGYMCDAECISALGVLTFAKIAEGDQSGATVRAAIDACIHVIRAIHNI